MTNEQLKAAKVVGFYSLPSPTLAERNPEGYNSALRDAPKGCGVGCCQYCGRGIVHNVIVRLTDGTLHAIGTDCAEKVGATEVRECVRERLTSDERAARAAGRQARQEAYDAQVAARQAVIAAKLAERSEVFKDVLAALDAGSEFHQSLASQLRFGPLSDRQAHFAAVAVVGRVTKKAKNEDAYITLCSRLTQ